MTDQQTAIVDAQLEVKRIARDHPALKLNVPSGAAALTSFAIRITVPTMDVWAKLAQALRDVGLKAEIAWVHSRRDEYYFQAEVHVPKHWRRPLRTSR